MSQLAPLSDNLPAWVVPATPQSEVTVIGISQAGRLYIYGDTPEQPGPECPAIIGAPVGIDVVERGQGSRYGPRPYLDLVLMTPIGSMAILRLPCKASLNPATGELQTPWSVRSLLGALTSIDLADRAFKFQAKRGREATFIQVFPYTPAGDELPELRAQAIGPAQTDLELAVDHIRRSFGQPPLFL